MFKPVHGPAAEFLMRMWSMNISPLRGEELLGTAPYYKHVTPNGVKPIRFFNELQRQHISLKSRGD